MTTTSVAPPRTVTLPAESTSWMVEMSSVIVVWSLNRSTGREEVAPREGADDRCGHRRREHGAYEPGHRIPLVGRSRRAACRILPSSPAKIPRTQSPPPWPRVPRYDDAYRRTLGGRLGQGWTMARSKKEKKAAKALDAAKDAVAKAKRLAAKADRSARKKAAKVEAKLAVLEAEARARGGQGRRGGIRLGETVEGRDIEVEGGRTEVDGEGGAELDEGPGRAGADDADRQGGREGSGPQGGGREGPSGDGSGSEGEARSVGEARGEAGSGAKVTVVKAAPRNRRPRRLPAAASPRDEAAGREAHRRRHVGHADRLLERPRGADRRAPAAARARARHPRLLAVHEGATRRFPPRLKLEGVGWSRRVARGRHPASVPSRRSRDR